MNEPDAAQRAAMRHGGGPALVIAGPGSGKTFVMTRRIAYLTDDLKIEPSSILTLTFTNAAAKEIRSRARSLIGIKASGMTFGTFHSVSFSILKQTYGLTQANILKPSEKYILLRDLIIGSHADIEDMPEAIDELSARINGVSYGNGLISEELGERLCLRYRERLRERRLLDFNDMLRKCHALLTGDAGRLAFWRERYRYIQVDEFQDTDSLQYELVKLLAGDDANIYAVGDDDQSIYGFRGGSFGVMKRFMDEHTDEAAGRKLSIYELGKNYRCCMPIVNAAVKVITENKDRIAKHQEAFDRTGPDVDIRRFGSRLEEAEEMMRITVSAYNDDIAVLVRTNELAGYYDRVLSAGGIRTSLNGRSKSLYRTECAEDVMAYMRLACGRYTRGDIVRCMNKPFRGIGREAFADKEASLDDAALFYKGIPEVEDAVRRFIEDINRMKMMKPENAMRYLMKVVGYEEYLMKRGTYLNDLYELYERSGSYSSLYEWIKASDMPDNGSSGENSTGIRILTLHACKGLEFREVFILDVNDGIIPYHRAGKKSETEEERRLFYVGMTRAERMLHIFYLNENNGKKMQPSRFLEALQTS